mmetsp:Transcript_91282/g.263404  ORF Transcript_91282/g.263404 Transcript_91282/m.263404 type:complete len:258 (-) Transcript_91282:112-885(-)
MVVEAGVPQCAGGAFSRRLHLRRVCEVDAGRVELAQVAAVLLGSGPDVAQPSAPLEPQGPRAQRRRLHRWRLHRPGRRGDKAGFMLLAWFLACELAGRRVRVHVSLGRGGLAYRRLFQALADDRRGDVSGAQGGAVPGPVAHALGHFAAAGHVHDEGLGVGFLLLGPRRGGALPRPDGGAVVGRRDRRRRPSRVDLSDHGLPLRPPRGSAWHALRRGGGAQVGPGHGQASRPPERVVPHRGVAPSGGRRGAHPPTRR